MLSFHVKFVQRDRWTDGQMARQTTVKQYAPDLSIPGHKKENSLFVCMVFNYLLNDKTIHRRNFKTFADDNLNVTEMAKLIFDRVENIVGKGENAGRQHFLLFQQGFQKLTFEGSMKVGIVW